MLVAMKKRSRCGELQEDGEDGRVKKRAKKEAEPLEKFLSLAENGDTVAGKKVYTIERES